MSSVAVIGAGAWGTALALQAARAGNQVTLWARDPARAASIAASRENPRLPGARLPPEIIVTSVYPVATDTTVVAVPMQFVRDILPHVPTAPLVIGAKGLETGTLRLPLEIAGEVRPELPAAVLTGPNFAHEIAAGLPAASVVAAGDAALRETIAGALGTASFRLYGNDDPIGAQVGGAAKNVIAIAAGAVIGAGLGENARAALITRGLAELSRLAVALGGRAETVMGLSGLGDLLLTCTGPASRNFSLGVALGRGEHLADVLAARSSVTEGVATAPALVARAQGSGSGSGAVPGSGSGAGIEMPVCAAVASLLAGQTSLAEAITSLLARPRRDE